MQHARARATDPGVSHAAAARVDEFVGAHVDRIYSCLEKHGPQTKDQIAARTGLTPVQVDRRLPEMERDGDVRTTGEVRKSASGRDERVWEAVA